MNSVFVLVLSTFTLVVASAVPKNFYLSYRKNFGCRIAGESCLNCEQSILCTDMGDNRWHITNLNKCDNKRGSSCLHGQCTNNTNPYCTKKSKVRFPCTAEGIFPDPFNCQAYHFCITNNTRSNGKFCEDRYGYDPKSTYCKNVLPTSGCPNPPPVPECKRVGERGALLLNKSIFYTCTFVVAEDGIPIVYPVLHLCPNGKTFNDDKCI